MLIRCRNQEWSSAARASTLRTAAFIVIASKSAPITLLTTSNENGEIAAARRAIIFSSDQYFSERCVWARILRMSARAHQQKRKMRRPPEAQVLPVHLGNSQQSRLHPALLRLEQVQTRRQRVPVLPRQKHQRRKRQRPQPRMHRLVRH